MMKAKQVRFLLHKQGFDTDDGYKGVPPWGVVIAIFYPYGKPGYFERDRRTPEFISWDWRACVKQREAEINALARLYGEEIANA